MPASGKAPRRVTGKPKSGLGKYIDDLNDISKYEASQNRMARKIAPDSPVYSGRQPLAAGIAQSLDSMVYNKARKTQAATMSTISSQAKAERKAVNRRNAPKKKAKK